MSEPKWAKGDWSVGADECSVVVTDAEGKVWPVLWADPVSPTGNDWQEANLALAAAAPELDAALVPETLRGAADVLATLGYPGVARQLNDLARVQEAAKAMQS